MGLSPPVLGIPPGPSALTSGRSALPVPHSAGEVQAGLLQVGLEVRQEEIPSALGADVGRPVFVHPLMGVKAAAIGHDHGTRGTNLGGEEHRERFSLAHSHVYKRAFKPFPQMDGLTTCNTQSSPKPRATGEEKCWDPAGHVVGDNLLVPACWVIVEGVSQADKMPFPGFSSQMGPRCSVCQGLAGDQQLGKGVLPEGPGAYSNQLSKPF